jgi:SAM-dependent methyltransferase
MSVSTFNLKPVSAAPSPCKICGGAASLYGVVDFHKTCAEAQGAQLPLSGVPIYYRRCAACGFLFTDAFDRWSDDEFKAHIYNDDYLTVYPDYLSTRPSGNANTVTQIWSEHRARIKVLDFGGGNDVLCTALRANGFPLAVTYDPMVPEYAQRPEGKFDLVTCFETLEHLPDPLAGIARILECVDEPGMIFYSTLLQPADIEQQGVDWWYVGPRNGHVSIFTQQALATAWGRYGYKTVSLSTGVHVAFRTLPWYLAHLQGKADSMGIGLNAAPAPDSVVEAAA